MSVHCADNPARLSYSPHCFVLFPRHGEARLGGGASSFILSSASDRGRRPRASLVGRSGPGAALTALRSPRNHCVGGDGGGLTGAGGLTGVPAYKWLTGASPETLVRLCLWGSVAWWLMRGAGELTTAAAGKPPTPLPPPPLLPPTPLEISLVSVKTSPLGACEKLGPGLRCRRCGAVRVAAWFVARLLRFRRMLR